MSDVEKELLSAMPADVRAATIQGLIDGKLPWEALQKLRTLVGQEIEDTSLASSVPRSKWKALYAALSRDMEGAAAQVGPDAQQALNRANNFTKFGHERIDGILDRVVGGQKSTAEEIFKRATNPSTMQEGGEVIGAVMKSLKPDERKAVTAALLKRMGRATPGQQNDTGDLFSSQTFLTNWAKMSPEAKRHIFFDPELRANLDQVARAANMIKEGSGVFANPSGTTGAAELSGTAGLIGGAIGSGHWGMALLGAGGVFGANMSARLLTNPTFVRWLAKTTTMPAELVPAQVNQITQYANKNWSAQDRADLDDFVKGLGGK
jgi:hypothetical protein